MLTMEKLPAKTLRVVQQQGYLAFCRRIPSCVRCIQFIHSFDGFQDYIPDEVKPMKQDDGMRIQFAGWRAGDEISRQ